MAKQFDLDKWKTPNTYDGDSFASLPNGCGIYLLVQVQTRDSEFSYRVLYVGQSINIARRLTGHDVKTMCDAWVEKGSYVRVYFRRCSRNELRIREKNLIKLLNPPFNLQHRVRGVV